MMSQPVMHYFQSLGSTKLLLRTKICPDVMKNMVWYFYVGAVNYFFIVLICFQGHPQSWFIIVCLDLDITRTDDVAQNDSVKLLRKLV